MNPFVKFILGAIVVLGVIVAAPFAIDRGLVYYDTNFDAYTADGAIVMSVGRLNPKTNRVLFHDARFPTTGLSLRVSVGRLTALEARNFGKKTPVGGTLRVMALASDEDAKPAPVPPENAVERFKFRFRLDNCSITQKSEDSRDGVELWSVSEKKEDQSNWVAVCVLTPESEEDAEVASELAAFRFERDMSHEFDFEFDTDLPEENELQFIYRKPIRRLFRNSKRN